MKKTLFALVVFAAAALQAEVILATNFDDRANENYDPSISSTWSAAEGVTNISSLELITGKDGSAITKLFDYGDAANNSALAIRHHLGTNGDISIDISLGLQSGYEGTVSGIDFSNSFIKTDGNLYPNNTASIYTLSLMDSENNVLASKALDPPGGANVASSINFDSAVALTDNQTYSLSLVVNNGGVNIRIDDLNINGIVRAASATPEPSSYALMFIGLCGLVLLGKRPRTA
ncbi:MAG: PEP-CTERM sorting domain-containing protein [Lentisphaeraceae bacterium]|nr:PEP-CTERM sorting domain-containing protein [Lentisphaeraceae bacterium]